MKFLAFISIILLLFPGNSFSGWTSSVREITYKNLNTALTYEDLDLPSGDYSFSGLTDSLPYTVTESDLGTNNLTIETGGSETTVKIVVTEASRPVDRDGWTIIETSEDTRIVYVSSSEGSDDSGMVYKASEIGVTYPDDEPEGEFLRKLTPTTANSHTHELGVISASSEVDRDWGYQPAWEAFDYQTDRDDRWEGDTKSEWIQFHLNTPAVATQYAISIARDRETRAPKDWTFEGSNDGESWDILHTVESETEWSGRERRVYTFDNSTEYEYYRLNISDNNGHTRVSIGYLEFMGPSETIAPFASLEYAHQMLRGSRPDWMLLKRGDTWQDPGYDAESFSEEEGNWGALRSTFMMSKSGRSLEEPALVGSYGSSPDRPRLAGYRFGLSGSNIVVRDISAMRMYGGHTNLLLENNFLSGHDSDGITFTNASSDIVNLEVRRNIIVDNHNRYGTGGHVQGMFAGGVHDLLLEENIIDRNGWHPEFHSPTMFNHNLYFSSTAVILWAGAHRWKYPLSSLLFDWYNTMHGIQEAGTCGILYAVSYSDIDQIPKESTQKRYGRLFKKKDTAGWEISSGDRNKGSKYRCGSYTYSGFNTAEDVG